jgi:hypothetical protein
MGLRLDMIKPADNPHTAMISGYGTKIRLQAGDTSGKHIILQLEVTAEHYNELLRSNSYLQLAAIHTDDNVCISTR